MRSARQFCVVAILLVSLAAGGRGIARAAVVVIDNRTPEEIHFTLAGADADKRLYRLQPGQVLPLHLAKKAVAIFDSEEVPRQQTLELNSIYSFQALPGGIELERTKFSRKAVPGRPAAPGQILPKLPGERPAIEFRPGPVIPVKILVDDEQKSTRQKWEGDLRQAVKTASDVIERHCGLRFEVVAVDTWESDDRAAGAGPLLADFERQVDPRPAWLAIGFTSQLRAVRGQVEGHPARLFPTHLLLRDWKGHVNQSERVELLVHQLGHYLGAVDSPEATSVMRPPSGDFRARAEKFPLQFDAANTLLLNVVAERIRKAGPADWAELPPKLQQQLTAIWAHIDDERVRAAPARKAPVAGKTRPQPRQPAPVQAYAVALVDGTRVSGQAIHDWGKKAENPRLDDQPLADSAHPVRWLRDNTLPVPVVPPAFVELVGGDRLPGKVVEYVPPSDGAESVDPSATPADDARAGSRAVPAHLIVEPEPGAILRFARQRPETRVRTAWLRRIVWQRSGNVRYEPNTLRLRGGGASTFRSLQFTATGVKLLKDDSVEQFAFAEIAEIHFPPVDAWTAYYQQLAVLSPEGISRLVRWEASDGLRFTGSLERFQAFDGTGDRPDGWVHLLQPAWSLTPLYVWHPSIRLRTWFEPHEFPLSALEPTATRRQAIFSSAWDWRADKNCRGGALRCGREEAAWGLGVHASSQLDFDLPAFATGLQTRVGLDRLAGRGGCARAAIYLTAAPQSPAERKKPSEPGGTPLFRSKLLLGSHQDQSAGALAFDGAVQGPRRLTLQADMVAGSDRPSGADPLDVRDTVDWIEPLLLLDRERLQREVERQAPRMIDAWAGWDLAEGQPRLANRWDKSIPRQATFRLDVAPAGERLTLVRHCQVNSLTNRLHIGVTRTAQSTASQIEVLVDGERIARFAVPVQGGKGSAGRSVPLGKYVGRRIEIQVIQIARGDRPLVDWRGLSIVE